MLRHASQLLRKQNRTPFAISLSPFFFFSPEAKRVARVGILIRGKKSGNGVTCECHCSSLPLRPTQKWTKT